jgi:hypothetical protein
MFYTFNNLTSYDSTYIPYDYEIAIANDLAAKAEENGVSLETAIKDFRDELTGADNGMYFCTIFETQLAMVGNTNLICEAEEAGYLDNVNLSDLESIDIRLREYLLDYHKEEILKLAGGME